jgi:5-methylcytosine-specific restriction protein A
MPWKAKHPCGHTGCPNLTDGRYCETHKSDAEKYRTETTRHYDRNTRDKNKYAFYHSAGWQTLAKAQLQRMPMCEECYRQGRITPAVIADHIVSIDDDYTRRYDPSNLQSLCRACHNRKHGRGQFAN